MGFQVFSCRSINYVEALALLLNAKQYDVILENGIIIDMPGTNHKCLEFSSQNSLLEIQELFGRCEVLGRLLTMKKTLANEPFYNNSLIKDWTHVTGGAVAL